MTWEADCASLIFQLLVFILPHRRGRAEGRRGDFVIGACDTIYISAKKDVISRKKSEYISVAWEKHQNPQSTKNENESFYKVHFNRKGYFLGQEKELV